VSRADSSSLAHTDAGASYSEAAISGRTDQRRMTTRKRESENLGVLAPSRARARAAAATLRRRMPGVRFTLLSLADPLVSGRLPDALVLCPGGAYLERDVDFLSRVSARALWPAPEGDLHGAIAGFLGHHLPVSSAPVRRGRASRKTALLIEGDVTPKRARDALRSDTRLWIVERASCVHLSERQLRRYRDLGVRWAALKPVRVVGLLASPELARARRRWQKLLPADTPVWVYEA